MKVCSTPGCPDLTNSTYCEAHLPPQMHRWHTSKRVSPPGWEKVRRRVLYAAKWKCYRCGGRATIADHHLPMAWGGAPLEKANLRAMCGRCHTAKTQDESRIGRRLKALPVPEQMAEISDFLREWG